MTNKSPETTEKAISKQRIFLPNGKEINIVYDCTDALVAKALRRCLKKKQDFSGEYLCEQIHRIKAECIAVTEDQFQEAIREAAITEDSMEPHIISSKYEEFKP